MSQFTNRQRQVLDLIGEGMGPREIAKRLGISDHTARKHRDEAVRRSGTGSQIRAVLEHKRGDNATA